MPFIQTDTSILDKEFDIYRRFYKGITDQATTRFLSSFENSPRNRTEGNKSE